MDDVFIWCMIGVILGGRVGYTIFYQPGYYLSNPGEILALWQGGMSFHGGLIGLLTAVGIFVQRRGLPFFAVTDIIAAVVPIGLFFGRIANFINAELYGRVTDLPWGVVFPGAGPVARHPSQLYEAGLEGLLLFILLMALIKLGYLAKTGVISGIFLIGYGLSRFMVEFVRLPDPQLGHIILGLSMGQLLSIPMIMAGVIILHYAIKIRTA
jgi:phosphatidylglycerol:prolipoprotein diacylglycerol transferase